MACRTPVIATPTGAAPELVAHGGGMLVAHEDPSGMAHAIETICKLPDAQWREMSDFAGSTAARSSWDESARLFEAALKNAIERTRRLKAG